MKKRLFFGVLVLSLVISACGGDDTPDPDKERFYPYVKERYGNYYEIFVGSFYDSTGNGMGDLRGVIQKLDYLNDGNSDSNTSLNINGIWFMPITPSPSYHKYDVKDYKDIDSAYGTMDDFEDLIAECNKRGIRIIIDLVVNHSSTQHPWFLAAWNGDANYQAYYNVADTKVNSNYYQLGMTGKWYEAVFWDQMPDLNYDNPEVKREMQEIVDFWIDKGVAGFRLDAVRHIYEGDQPKNIEWLRWFVNYCESKKDDIYIVGEIWSSESTIEAYYASGVPSNFNFRAAEYYLPRTITGSTQASRFSQFVVEWNAKINAKRSNAIDAPFLTNHDIDRFATVIKTTDPAKLKMAASMLLFMPGNPFIYYGEELGMTGDLPSDENVRGPMIWSRTDTTGETFGPTGNTRSYWRDSSVSEQLTDADSILRFYIDAMKLKNRYPSVHWGTPSLLTTSTDNSIAAYKLSGREGEQDLAIVHNIGSDTQTITIDGVTTLGGTLTATGVSAEKPTLEGTLLTMPAYSSAVLEY